MFRIVHLILKEPPKLGHMNCSLKHLFLSIGKDVLKHPRWRGPCRFLPGSGEQGLVLIASAANRICHVFRLAPARKERAQGCGTASTRNNAPPLPPERLKAGEQVGKSRRSSWSKELRRSQKVACSSWYSMCGDQVPGVRCLSGAQLGPALHVGWRKKLGVK